MRTENIWQIFRETGDPVCYLLYRAEAKAEVKEAALTDSAADINVTCTTPGGYYS